MDYEKYLKLKREVSNYKKEYFGKLEDGIKDFEDELEDMKNKLVLNAPSGSVKPDLVGIARIFELIDLDMEFDEDLYFDVKRFKKRYNLYQNLKCPHLH